MDEIFEHKRHAKYCRMGHVGGPKSSRCTCSAVLSVRLSSISPPATVCVAAVRSLCSCTESPSGGNSARESARVWILWIVMRAFGKETLNSVHATRL